MWRLAVIAFALVLMAAAAPLQTPSPRAGQQDANKGTTPAEHQQPTSSGADKAPSAVLDVLNKPNASPEADLSKTKRLEKSAPDWWGPEWSVVWATVGLILVGALQVGMFFVQLGYMRDGVRDAKIAAEAARLTAEATAIAQRARIEIVPGWSNDGPRAQYALGQVPQPPQYRFHTIMQNAGRLPAVNVRNMIDWAITKGGLPSDFTFPDEAMPMTQTGVFGTSRSLVGPHVPKDRFVTAQEIDRMQQEEIRFYFFGWVKYFDGFPGSPERTTRFCYWVRVTGNPELPVTFIADHAYNSAD